MYVIMYILIYKYMRAKTTISISEARKKIFDIAKEVQKPGVHFTLTENGRPKAVVMSVEEFESWAETLEVMQDFPDLKKDLEKTDKAIKSGEYKNWSSLEDLLAKEGLLIADKSKKKYGLPVNNQTARGKRTKKNK
jgi:prevent-host-death family protein